MKNIALSTLLLSCLFIASCSEDFEVSAPYKKITVAYGILNISDTAHYIRIQKAFLDETKNAITMAANADSSYYPESEIEVKILEFKSGSNSLVSTTVLNRVDLTSEGYPKDPPKNGQGFFNTPNYGYKFKKPLAANLQYQLLIVNKVTGRTDSSNLFALVNNETTKGNSNFYVSVFENAGYQVAFPRTTANSKLSFSGTMPANGKIVEGHIIFHYMEKDRNSGAEKRKDVDMLIGTDVIDAGGQFTVEIPNASVYSYLYSEIGAAPAGIERYMDSCDIKIYAGSNELYTYKEITLGQTGGITGDQIKPIYTNMKGLTALGVIGSRAVNLYRNAVVTSVTLDSIRKNPITNPLNFVGYTTD
jgi:hypothetical protein